MIEELVLWWWLWEDGVGGCVGEQSEEWKHRGDERKLAERRQRWSSNEIKGVEVDVGREVKAVDQRSCERATKAYGTSDG